MAVLNLSITIPDAQIARVQNALRITFELPAATNAQLIERLRQEVMQHIKQIVWRHEKQAALAALDVPPVDVDTT